MNEEIVDAFEKIFKRRCNVVSIDAPARKLTLETVMHESLRDVDLWIKIWEECGVVLDLQSVEIERGQAKRSFESDTNDKRHKSAE